MPPSRARRRRPRRVAGLKISSRRTLHSGFLRLERLTARNVYGDGTASPLYRIETVHRRELDCVSATLWFREPATGKTFVGVRRALRASMAGRAAMKPPLREKPRQWFWEAVAGSLEPGDRGPAGLRRRMRQEILEETGLRLPLSALKSQGAGFFPSHGQSTEKIHLFQAEIPPQKKRLLRAPAGERGEEGATLHFVELEEAIRRCRSGIYEDPKLEIGFRRMRERLARSRKRTSAGPR